MKVFYHMHMCIVSLVLVQQSYLSHHRKDHGEQKVTNFLTGSFVNSCKVFENSLQCISGVKVEGS